MKDKIIRAKDFVNHNKVQQISENMFEVEGHKVSIQKKSGRTLILCDCDNASRFGHNQFCISKLAIIIYLANKDLLKRVDKLVLDYKRIKDLKMKIDTDIVIDDLENLRRNI